MTEIPRRTTCRVCESSALTALFSLGDFAVSDFVPFRKVHAGVRCPLNLQLCGKCGLVQLEHTAPQELLYSRHYWYRSGTTDTMRAALRDVALAAQRLVPLSPWDIVLDIGSNDGTLLRNYPTNVLTVGVEPATNLAEEGAKGIDVFVNDFWNVETYEAALVKFIGHRDRQIDGAKIVTACGMFYDLEDPNAFIRDVAAALHEDGVFVAQLMCLKNMMDVNDVGNICFKPDTLLLGQNQKIGEVKVGDMVYDQCGRLSKVKKLYSRKYKGEMVTVKAMYLEKVVCTPEHPILVARMEYPSARAAYKEPGEKNKKGPRSVNNPLKNSSLPKSNPSNARRAAHTFTWEKAENVKRGDFLVVPRIKPTEQPCTLDLKKFNSEKPNNRFMLEELPFNEDFAWLMGLYVAEGCRSGDWDRQPMLALTLHSEEKHLFRKVKRIMATIGYKVSCYPSKVSKAMTVPITCAPMARAFEEWFGRGATQKRVPEFLMKSDEVIKKSFLQGLFEGDGYNQKNKIHLHSSSKLLIEQVQLMLASMGAMVGVGYVKPYPREIRGMPVVSKDSWQLRGSSKELAKIFNYKHVGRGCQHGYKSEDYILVPVSKVGREQYEGLVCNVETDDHTYLVSNAVVHNCHEHLEYYSLQSLQHLYEKNGLQIFDVETNDVNGRSYRIYAKLQRSRLKVPAQCTDRLFEAMRIEERQLGNAAHLWQWWHELEDTRRRVVEFVNLCNANEKTVAVFGASTKGNTLLQWLNLAPNQIAFAIDRSPSKVGLYTVGTGIPIVSDDEGRSRMPDFCLLLPFAFKREFMDREADQEWRKRGGKFISISPKFEVF